MAKRASWQPQRDNKPVCLLPSDPPQQRISLKEKGHAPVAYITGLRAVVPRSPPHALRTVVSSPAMDSDIPPGGSATVPALSIGDPPGQGSTAPPAATHNIPDDDAEREHSRKIKKLKSFKFVQQQQALHRQRLLSNGR